MSAVVCGSKRSLFDDIPSPPSPPSCKKIRRFSPSSSSSSPPPAWPAPAVAHLDRLLQLFPHMEPQVILERALVECGDDVEAAIRRLHELCLGPAADNGGFSEEPGVNVDQGDRVDADVPCEPSTNLPVDGAGWVDVFVKEMMSATSLDDARARATRVLEFFEQSVSGQAGAEAVKSVQKEHMMLKEQMEAVLRENAILKRAVAIQHERQKEHEEKNRELQHLKQLVSQYQEQLRVLEVNNYALSMHLRQAQQSNSFHGSYPPDVF
ncbi:hypothetical protein EUGRSUZ_F03883 [Eucalyptus grandis]|uniref:Uncharacterized protein n=2 Tax=Eucalyptus grandis TaxID=71139 RepID=A0ACC3KN77_EUCGR|nr:hypothetical protein EUGRSUZ_F03883 [Eucalyptus grandis]